MRAAMGIVAVLCVLMLAGGAMAVQGTVAGTVSGTVGEDQVPYTLARIEKAAGFTTLTAWIEASYGTDEGAAVYALPRTIMTGRLAGMSGAAFKTWELNNYVQNVVADEGSTLLLLTTPHGEYNPDGGTVLGGLIGMTLPETEYTSLSEENAPVADGAVPSIPDLLMDRTLLPKGSSFGSSVGSYKSVTAYSNGSTGYASGISSYYGSYCTGYKWQCVEYVTRFYKARYGDEIRGGNANTFYSKASSKGLSRAANGSSTKPSTGDILCSGGGDYGHVAIVRDVGDDYVKVIQQNWSNSSSDESKKLSMSVTKKSGTKYYTVSGFNSSYSIQGWLWD